MKNTRKLIFHGKAHDLNEREEDSSKAARDIAARNRKNQVKLFFEGYCIGQEIPKERKRKFVFEPTPIEKREILDLEILVSCAAILNKAAATRKSSQMAQRGERERKYVQIEQEDADEDLENRNLRHMLLNFGKFTEEEVGGILKTFNDGGYVIQPFLRRIIKAKLEQINREMVRLEAQELRGFFEREGLETLPQVKLEYQEIYRELRFLEPKGEADPIKIAFMLDAALKEAEIIREARIVRSILETDFEIGILNIGLGHVETGRIGRWLREKGVETENDPKTNRLREELKGLFEKIRRKERELEKLREEYYQDLM